jgi:hypothetical protein
MYSFICTFILEMFKDSLKKIFKVWQHLRQLFLKETTR